MRTFIFLLIITITATAQDEWEFIGPDNYPSPHPGFKKIFVVSPDTICFAGTPGFCVTFNGGDTWVARTNGITGTTDMTMDENNHFYMSGMGGIFKSTNWGEVWTRLDDSFVDKEFSSIKAIDDTLYVANFSGVFKSYDKGLNWLPTSYIYYGITVIDGVGTDLFMGARTLSYPGFFHSRDGGNTWSGHPFGVLDLLRFEESNILVASETVNHGLHFSQNNGESFVNTNYFTNNFQIINDLAVNHRGELFLSMTNYITHTNDGVFITSDGLGEWTNIGLEGKLVTELAVDNEGTLYAGVEGEGIYYYTGPYTPVELSSFSANVAGASVILNWQAATETNNRGFEIERGSNDSWNKIGFVAGQGTVNNQQEYSFIDNNPEPENRQYRLKQIDYNGDYKYSEVVSVLFGYVDYSLNQNYPNPFNPTTTISFTLKEECNVKIKIYDTNGQFIQKITEQVYSRGNHEIKFDGEYLASGTYLYKIEAINHENIPVFFDMGKMLLLK